MRSPLAVIALVLLLVVVACSNEADRPEQTWSKDYEKTTCTEWNQSMTKTQKEAAAYDLVVDYLRRTDSDKKPSNDQVDDFRSEISAGCEKEAGTVSEVAEHLGYDR